MRRVPLEDLVIDDEYGRYLYDDMPFLGSAYRAFPDGRTQEEIPFADGYPEGLIRTWYPDGRQASEESVLGGRRHGRTREWHPNGKLKHEGMYEFGICTRATDWDRSGRVVREYHLEPGSANYEMLTRFRSISWEDPAVRRLLSTEASEEFFDKKEDNKEEVGKRTKDLPAATGPRG